MSAELPPVYGRAEQLEQVFLNVLVNAWHAMPEGTLTIAAAVTTDQAIRLSFGDTGVGMSAEVLARAFEPFYSTKGERGTGLGLAICKRIIEGHQGMMYVESTPGGGTTVIMELPQADILTLLLCPYQSDGAAYPLTVVPVHWSYCLRASGAGRSCKAACTMSQSCCNLKGLARHRRLQRGLAARVPEREKPS